ncbi:MAG TPA: hypothetical protein VH593_23260 [Ktedonobacteraceae bacterium]
MPELYIGNVSKQIFQFAYRALERPGVVVQTIPIGGQIRVSPNGSRIDLTTPEIDHIIDQHRIYGMLPVDEIDSSKDPFSGLCYSIGKPITAEKLWKAMKKKEEALNKFGQQMRQEAALAVNAQIEEQVGPLRQLEMSFAEEEPRGGYADDMNHLAEGIRVTREGGFPTAENGRRARR